MPGGGATDRAAFIDYVREHADAVIATIGPAGEPQAAFLPVAVTELGELVFDARRGSRKVTNLERDPRIALVLGGRDGTTLQCEGTADLPEGEERARLAESYASAFPEFADSLGLPEIVVIRVRAEWARLGDYREGAGSVRELRLRAARHAPPRP